MTIKYICMCQYWLTVFAQFKVALKLITSTILYLIITLLLQTVPGMRLGGQTNCSIDIAKIFNSSLCLYTFSQLAGKQKSDYER